MGSSTGISAISSWRRNGTKFKAQHHVKWRDAGLLFCHASGLFLRIKPPVCRLLFFAILTRCPRFITTTVRFLDRNGHFSSYREKAREEKEGERRLWERCVNRLRFSTVSIAAAMARRFSHLGRSSNRNLDYFLDLFIQVLTL